MEGSSILIRGSDHADATTEMTKTGFIGVITSMVPVILSSMTLFAK